MVDFEERDFRQALGAFPTGVAIVTGKTETGERLGMTVSSFNSVSLSPPLVLFSIAHRVHSLAAWTRLRRYAVNILSQDQEDVSNRFARPLADKWSGLQVVEGKTGVPLLWAASVAFECEAYARYDGGDHDIFVVQVTTLHSNLHKQRPPLIFFGGRYRQLDVSFRHSPAEDAYLFPGW